MNIGWASLRWIFQRPPGKRPLVAIIRLTSGPPLISPFWKGWRVLRCS